MQNMPRFGWDGAGRTGGRLGWHNFGGTRCFGWHSTTTRCLGWQSMGQWGFEWHHCGTHRGRCGSAPHLGWCGQIKGHLGRCSNGAGTHRGRCGSEPHLGWRGQVKRHLERCSNGVGRDGKDRDGQYLGRDNRWDGRPGVGRNLGRHRQR
jgi:hypothetical protein